MQALDPGTLNKRITIQQQGTVQDQFGQPTQVWDDLCYIWAAIRTASSREVYASQGFVAQLSHVITIRFPAVTVKTSMRVQYGQRMFLIQGVSDPNEAHIQLDLLCLEST